MSNSTYSLGKQLVQAVQKQAAMQRPLPLTARSRSTLGGTPLEAKVVLHDNDRFSHMAGELNVKLKDAKPKAQNTQRKAEQFCERASYLTERLQFVESDAVGNAIVRSTPATMRGARSEYFEGRVSSDEISLKRYQPHADKPGREAVPFCVTDEVLERLADDAAGVLAAPPRLK